MIKNTTHITVIKVKGIYEGGKTSVLRYATGG